MSELTKCIKIAYPTLNGWRDVRLIGDGNPDKQTFNPIEFDNGIIDTTINFYESVSPRTVHDSKGRMYQVIIEYGDDFPE